MALLDILLDRSGAIGGRIRSERLKAGRDSYLQKRPPLPTRTVIIAASGEKLIFDAATDIQHEFSSKVTSYSVEDKAQVSDHVVNENPTFSVSGVFSDASLNIESIPNTYKQYQVYQILLKMYDDKKTVTLLTPLDTYDNLIITRIGIPRTAGQGKALFIDIDFEKIRRVSNELTTVFAGSSRSGGPGSNDKQKKTEGDTAVNGTTEKNAGNKKTELAPEGVVSKVTIAGENTSTPFNTGSN